MEQSQTFSGTHQSISMCGISMIPYEKRTKLDERSVKSVMMGVSKESKAYWLDNPVKKKVVISRDVRFDENKKWEWEKGPNDVGLQWDGSIHESEGEENEDTVTTPVEGEIEKNNTPIEENNTPEEVTQTQHSAQTSSGTITVREISSRPRQTAVWMKDYVTEKGANLFFIYGEDVMAMYTSSEDPESFEEAVKLETWRKAMEAKISSIEENNT